jgi:hypothetical protein
MLHRQPGAIGEMMAEQPNPITKDFRREFIATETLRGQECAECANKAKRRRVIVISVAPATSRIRYARTMCNADDLEWGHLAQTLPAAQFGASPQK